MTKVRLMVSMERCRLRAAMKRYGYSIPIVRSMFSSRDRSLARGWFSGLIATRACLPAGLWVTRLD